MTRTFTQLKLALLFAFFAVNAIGQTNIYMTSKDDLILRVIDSASGNSVSTVTMSATGATIQCVNGLEIHPCTDEVFAIFQVQGQSGRSLGIINALQSEHKKGALSHSEKPLFVS